ncbi:flagellar biosynthesis anti-sigma factor FlgM [Rhodanobacter sp. MP7CTX1]|jgi:negative regulator of flagellin synthesis FlgM|uniref:flagellar biosynthesis anti-sigma factor FlgM n=1 Tax=Rhodanobacter sp. MP7CTX1 TaxID=2723084 RepID=UPI00161B3C95|nr:flagellar biosynthesis anti-sigma factor FlgM [Rhodanobacter sp. MP7CTX1]MBB6186277.1 negative regulator of flagellin synthesis FlgM [Rhodanobacter sp. MP7CTX1]
MNTTISPNGLPALPQAKTNQGSNGSQAGSTVAGGSSAAQADDSVKLTDSARALQQASSTNAQSPVDTARVEQIRKSLTDGTYSVDAGKIADRLTSLESQINGTP